VRITIGNDVNNDRQIANKNESTRRFVDWVRAAAPYVHAFGGRTFVIGFGGEVAMGSLAQALAQDCNLLAALGIRLVLVHGARRRSTPNWSGAA